MERKKNENKSTEYYVMDSLESISEVFSTVKHLESVKSYSVQKLFLNVICQLISTACQLSGFDVQYVQLQLEGLRSGYEEFYLV
jgi:hypothetical protein